jgi:hypothetical protein
MTIAWGIKIGIEDNGKAFFLFIVNFLKLIDKQEHLKFLKFQITHITYLLVLDLGFQDPATIAVL